MVPTTISDNAVEMRNQIDKRLATKARPIHNAASAQTPVIRLLLLSFPKPITERLRVHLRTHASETTDLAAGGARKTNSHRRHASGRSHQPQRRLRGDSIPLAILAGITTMASRNCCRNSACLALLDRQRRGHMETVVLRK